MVVKRECPSCGKEVPIQAGDTEVPEFKNHPRGFRMGPCPASGEPVDIELTELFSSDDSEEEGEWTGSTGKPAHTRK